MESLFILIPLSVLAVVIAIGVFFKMNSNGQFDDDQGPAWSVLLDDDRTDSAVEADTGSVANASKRGQRTALDLDQ